MDSISLPEVPKNVDDDLPWPSKVCLKMGSSLRKCRWWRNINLEPVSLVISHDFPYRISPVTDDLRWFFHSYHISLVISPSISHSVHDYPKKSMFFSLGCPWLPWFLVVNGPISTGEEAPGALVSGGSWDVPGGCRRGGRTTLLTMFLFVKPHELDDVTEDVGHLFFAYLKFIKHHGTLISNENDFMKTALPSSYCSCKPSGR